MSPRASTPSSIRRRTRTVTAAGALLLAVIAPSVYAQVRIGVVDIRRAVTETSEGRSASDAIKMRYDARQRDLNGRTHEIEALKQHIEHPTAPIPQARLQKMAQQYQQRVLEVQQLGQQYTQELQEMEAQMTKTILSKMQPLVREIALSDNYQLIVDEQVVHYSQAALNLTDRVIQVYNQRFPVTPGHPMFPAAPPTPAGAHPAAGGPSSTPAHPAPGPASTPPVEPAEPPEHVEVPAPATTPNTGVRRVLPGVFYRRDGGT